MPTTPYDRLKHIKAAIAAAHDGVGGLTLDTVEGIPFLRGGLSYQILNMREAARNIPEKWKQTFGPEIDWRGLEDIGNRLRHAYQHANLSLLWDIYQNDLDPLEAAIDRMLAAQAGKPSR